MPCTAPARSFRRTYGDWYAQTQYIYVSRWLSIRLHSSTLVVQRCEALRVPPHLGLAHHRVMKAGALFASRLSCLFDRFNVLHILESQPDIPPQNFLVSPLIACAEILTA